MKIKKKIKILNLKKKKILKLKNEIIKKKKKIALYEYFYMLVL